MFAPATVQQLLLPVTTTPAPNPASPPAAATIVAESLYYQEEGEFEEEQPYRQSKVSSLPAMPTTAYPGIPADGIEALYAWVDAKAPITLPSNSSSSSMLLGMAMLQGQALESLYTVGVKDRAANIVQGGVLTGLEASAAAAGGAVGMAMGPVVATAAAISATAAAGEDATWEAALSKLTLGLPAMSGQAANRGKDSNSSSRRDMLRSWDLQLSSVGPTATTSSSISKSSIFVRPLSRPHSSSSSSSTDGLAQGQLSQSLMAKLSRLPQRLYVHHGEHAGAANGAEHTHPLLQGLFSPPTIAGIAAMIIGSCTPLKVRMMSHMASCA
jgi:hypothetical protein